MIRRSVMAESGKSRTVLTHWWCPCSECGEGTYLQRQRFGRRCVITPKCSGTHRPERNDHDHQPEEEG